MLFLWMKQENWWMETVVFPKERIVLDMSIQHKLLLKSNLNPEDIISIIFPNHKVDIDSGDYVWGSIAEHDFEFWILVPLDRIIKEYIKNYNIDYNLTVRFSDNENLTMTAAFNWLHHSQDDLVFMYNIDSVLVIQRKFEKREQDLIEPYAKSLQRSYEWIDDLRQVYRV